MGMTLKKTAMVLFRVLATSRTDQPKQVCRYGMGGTGWTGKGARGRQL